MSSLPTHTINFLDKISCFELGWSEFMTEFVCIALMDKIILAIIKFPEDNEMGCLEWKELKELHSDSRIEALSISPESSLAVMPKNVIFCAAGSDFNLRIYTSDLAENDTVQVLSGHKSYINSIAWDYGGEFLASGSDDHTVALWKIGNNYSKEVTLYFKSSVMAVKWHQDEPDRLLVAEKAGVIHLYNAPEKEILLSVESPRVPLMGADWAPSNAAFITCISAGETFVWDLKAPCRPVDKKHIHEDVGMVVQFSPHNELVTASIGRPLTTLKIVHCKSQLPQVEAALSLFGGLSWHARHPYVAAAQDRRLCFWKVLVK